MFFDSWQAVSRIIVIGSLAYVALVVLLRISGKRTLAKFNAYDFVVSVALGSTLATTLLTKSVSLVDGVVAFVVLIGLQFIVAWTTTRFRRWEAVVNNEPSLLLYDGAYLPSAMQRQRVTEGELLSAIRKAHAGSLSEVAAVVLEPSGELSVVLTRERPDRGALEKLT